MSDSKLNGTLKSKIVIIEKLFESMDFEDLIDTFTQFAANKASKTYKHEH